MAVRVNLKEKREERLKGELDNIIDKLIDKDTKKIILFGSMAREQVNRYSDIDLIVIKDTKKRFLDRLEEVYTNAEPSLSVDILVYTPQEFQEMRQWSSFIKGVLKEGRVLYEAQ